ncbi:kielin/chordin-like protein [Babylonia areolata]|uniref:kielin/chordin-like protein n=1 Tax=Babylonia areolata TaxID=304850 RepID=UPI003FD49460
MERPHRSDYRLFKFFLILVSRLCVFQCHDDDTGIASTLTQRLNDLRMANFPILHSFAADDREPDRLCKTWIGTVVSEKSRWEEDHCRQCECHPVLGTVCSYPTCDKGFLPYLDSNCEEWSSDNCCCLRTSCLHEGVRYAADDWFLLTSSDPCTVCKCDPSDGLPQCFEMTCPETECVNPTRTPGECCPLCMGGRNCTLPSLSVPEGDVITDASPIGESTSRVVKLVSDSSQAWNCTCLVAGTEAHCVSLESRSSA